MSSKCLETCQEFVITGKCKGFQEFVFYLMEMQNRYFLEFYECFVAKTALILLKNYEKLNVNVAKKLLDEAFYENSD